MIVVAWHMLWIAATIASVFATAVTALALVGAFVAATRGNDVSFPAAVLCGGLVATPLVWAGCLAAGVTAGVWT